jgi:hypothetical protein
MNDIHGSPEFRSRPGAAPIERPAMVAALNNAVGKANVENK